MSEELVNSVHEKIKSETWTRASISNFKSADLKALSDILAKAKAEDCIDAVKEACDEQLKHASDSITALYLSGMISLGKGALDNSALVSLVGLFQNHHKEPMVVELCKGILDVDPANKFALRTLIGCYKNNDPDGLLWPTCETLVKVDFEEADVTRMLAEHYEREGDTDAAKTYYKKALLRYVNGRNMNGIREVWSKLVSLVPEEIDFFLMVQRKVAKSVSDLKSSLLMQEVYQHYKDTENWNIAIDILKLILGIDQKDAWARREIIECFKGKYKNHSHLDEYIKSSNLTSNFRNIFEAISDFEKHIAFDAKHFVFHRTWGVGVIRSVDTDNLVINFGKKVGVKEMSLKIAVSALQPLEKDHIWVLKATKSREELAKKVKEDPNWTLKRIIRSFGNCCDFKQIKAELVPSILDEKSWTNWNTKAKKEIERDATFGVAPNNSSAFVVRDREISREEKLSNEFKAQKQFFARIDILMRFLQDDDTDKESELFADMFSYFTGYLKSFSSVNEQVVASYLVVERIGKEIPALHSPQKFTFAQIFGEIENPAKMYDELKDTKNTFLRADFLAAVRLLPEWADIYIRLFPTVLKPELLSALTNSGFAAKVQQLAADSFENYREYRSAAIYFFSHCQEEEWFKEAGIPYEKQLITLLNIISQCYKEINGHVDTTENKKIISTAEDLLFKKRALIDYVLENDLDTIKRIYTLVNDVKNLDGAEKTLLRREIQKKHPDFKFQEAEEKAEAPKGLIVTRRKMDEKKAELDKLVNVEVPKNAEEIGEAAAKGDLKENADFIAAKEYQRFLNGQISKLTEELGRATVFDPTTVTTEYISFGTTTTLLNKNSGGVETYTILGPWESDPANKVISYMSPLGNAMLNARSGEELNFRINETEYSFKVESIKAAEL